MNNEFGLKELYDLTLKATYPIEMQGRIFEPGEVIARFDKIQIANFITRGVEQSYTSKLNTFYHELTHAILKTMGEYELNNNERFVCTFSSLLTEAIRSFKYE
jgi:hypothetical protein